MDTTRRGLLSSILLLASAPAIVKADSLMRIAVPKGYTLHEPCSGDFTLECWFDGNNSRIIINTVDTVIQEAPVWLTVSINKLGRT